MARLAISRGVRGFCHLYTTISTRYIHDIARFFEVPNGGSLHPDCDLTMKPTSGCMLRAHPTRAMKKREAMAREERDISHGLSGPCRVRNIRSAAADGRGVQRHFARDDSHSGAMEGQSRGGRMVHLRRAEIRLRRRQRRLRAARQENPMQIIRPRAFPI